MRHDEKKIVKIIEELTVYFFALGANQIRSDINRDGCNTVILFQANYNPEYESNLYYLEEYLNCPKNDGIEDVYWELAGSGDPGETSQLLLIGMMIDKAEIRTAEGFVYLKLYRGGQE
ncbi:MAG: hypothetical protein MR430_04445 [Lachnospiraceae bacterium]|nr:hypothetical protein [Lachnospiraceae bacterium]